MTHFSLPLFLLENNLEIGRTYGVTSLFLILWREKSCLRFSCHLCLCCHPFCSPRYSFLLSFSGSVSSFTPLFVTRKKCSVSVSAFLSCSHIDFESSSSGQRCNKSRGRSREGRSRGRSKGSNINDSSCDAIILFSLLPPAPFSFLLGDRENCLRFLLFLFSRVSCLLVSFSSCFSSKKVSEALFVPWKSIRTSIGRWIQLFSPSSCLLVFLCLTPLLLISKCMKKCFSLLFVSCFQQHDFSLTAWFSFLFPLLRSSKRILKRRGRQGKHINFRSKASFEAEKSVTFVLLPFCSSRIENSLDFCFIWSISFFEEFHSLSSSSRFLCLQTSVCLGTDCSFFSVSNHEFEPDVDSFPSYSIWIRGRKTFFILFFLLCSVKSVTEVILDSFIFLWNFMFDII